MPSTASAHLVPPATTSPGSVTVPQASRGPAVSRVGDRLGVPWGSGCFRAQAPRPLAPGGAPGRTRAPAWLRLTPPACTPACPPGTFGESCGQKCQCPGENQACHPASGACVCAAGYHGSGCRQRECCPCTCWALGEGGRGGRSAAPPCGAGWAPGPGSWPSPCRVPARAVRARL